MIIEYVAIIVGALYWVYNTRLRIGYKASFYRAYVSGGSKPDVFYDVEGNIVDIMKGVYSYVFDDSNNVVDIVHDVVSNTVKLYKWIGEKEFKATDKVISFKGKTFVVDFDRLTCRKYGFEYLNFDFENESIINFGGEYFTSGDAETVDNVMSGGMFTGLFKLGEKLSGMQKLMIVMSFGLGAMIVAIVCIAVYQGYIIPDMLQGWVPREDTVPPPLMSLLGGLLG